MKRYKNGTPDHDPTPNRRITPASIKSNMEVLLLKRPQSRMRADQTSHENKAFFLRIRLHSDTRPGHISFQDVEMGRDFRKRVERAGAALAIHQITMLGDQHEPSLCARTARELALEVIASQ